jgi:hypothetical protein
MTPTKNKFAHPIKNGSNGSVLGNDSPADNPTYGVLPTNSNPLMHNVSMLL